VPNDADERSGGGFAAIDWGPDEASRAKPVAGQEGVTDDGGLFTEGTEPFSPPSPERDLHLWTDDEESKVKSLLKPVAKRPQPGQDKGRTKPRHQVDKPPRLRRVLKWSLYLLLVLFVADLVYVGVGVRLRLTAAAEHLDQMRASLEAGLLPSAGADLRAADRETSDAMDLLGQPAFRILESIPVIREDAASIRGVALAASHVIDAGEPGLEAASLLDYRGGTIGRNLYDDGRINLELLAQAEPLLVRVEDSLDAAENELTPAETGLLPPVRSAVEEARGSVAEARSLASGAVSLLRVLPPLTGAQEPRRYLLAFQALGEARATGGVVGLFGVLEATDGQLRLKKVASYSEINFPELPASTVPNWYRKNYGVQGALRQWPQANLSPNFAIDSKVMLEMYESSSGEALDGVIAVDAVALADMMQGTGPFTIPGFDETITSDNVARILSQDAYTDFTTKETQNLFFAQLVETFWSRIESGSVDAEALARGVGDAVGSQHLKVYVAGGEDQATLDDLHATGSLERFGPNLQAVFHNNYGINKVDYFLHREMDSRIEIGAGGDLRVTTTVLLRNEAPEGPPSTLLGGIENDLVPGTNRMILNFLAPTGAKLGRIEIDGKSSGSITYSDSGHPTIWDVVTVPPGEESIAKLVYVVPGGAAIDEEGGRLSFSFLPQPTLNVDDFTMTLVVPSGYSVAGHELSEGNELVLERQLEEPLTLDLEFEPTS
jgi:hypothetical protein